MSILTQLINFLLTPRRKAIDYFRDHPAEVQAAQLAYLLSNGAQTALGQKCGLTPQMSVQEFQAAVGVCDYDLLSPMIDRCRRGEANVLWPGTMQWFAKSSGTTGSRSKYIPVTDSGLNDSHMQGPRDVMAIFTDLYPDSNVFSGKTLTLGGSHRIESEGELAQTGDLSAIMIENTPTWANMRRAPSRETALIADFDQKVKAICDEAIAEDITSFAGVPSWNMVLMQRVLDYTGASNIHEVWPNMELFIHGGMRFQPYRKQYARLFPKPQMKYMETYNASEGFFAIADDSGREDMLLMLDYKIFYEFLPAAQIDDTSKAIPLEGVETGVNYAMIITTSNGLWRYMIGDTVEFTSTSPYRIRITGRTQHFINAFGEEVIIDNAEQAIAAACLASGAEVSEYTVAPVFMELSAKGRHQWLVEFNRTPDSIDAFSLALDRKLREVNSDYDAKRIADTTLLPPIVTMLPVGSFQAWMKGRGKSGGQNKVPRLYNDRTYADELLMNIKP